MAYPTVVGPGSVAEIGGSPKRTNKDNETGESPSRSPNKAANDFMASGHRSDLEDYVPAVKRSKTKDKNKERLEGISHELKSIEKRQKDNFRQGQKPKKNKRDLSETADFLDEQLDNVLGAIQNGDLNIEDTEEHADRLKGKLPKFTNLPDFIIETLGLAL